MAEFAPVGGGPGPGAADFAFCPPPHYCPPMPRSRTTAVRDRTPGILAAACLALAPSPRAAAATLDAPWDRGGLYQMTATNKPAAPAPAAPSALEILDTLDDRASAPFEESIFGAAQALYAMTRPPDTNLPPDARALEQERSFSILLRDVERLTREGRAEEAIATLKQQLNKPMPPHQRAQINNRIAAYYFRMQRYADSLPFMREAVRLDPQDYPTLCNLAAVLMSMGELKEAGFFLRTLDATKIVEPRLLFSVYFNRACLYSLNHEFAAAFEDLKKAAQADPHSTLASLGDPQLDGIRPSLNFFDLKSQLEAIIAPTAPVVP